MFCDFRNLANRHFLFCILQFISSTSSSISMCMSAYGLSLKKNSEFSSEQLIILSCILTSVITHAIKDSLISNPDLLKKKTNDEENKNFIDI